MMTAMTLLSKEKSAMVISILLHLVLYAFLPLIRLETGHHISPIPLRIKILAKEEIIPPKPPVKKEIIRPIAREKVKPVTPQSHPPLAKRSSSLREDIQDTRPSPDPPIEVEEESGEENIPIKDGTIKEESFAQDITETASIPAVPENIEPEEPTFTPLFLISRMPMFEHRVEPIYPESARMIGKEGEVILEVSISKEGKVIGTSVVKKAGYGFDKAAIKAMLASTFMPAMLDDKPVAVKVRIPVKFRLID